MKKIICLSLLVLLVSCSKNHSLSVAPQKSPTTPDITSEPINTSDSSSQNNSSNESSVVAENEDIQEVSENVIDQLPNDNSDYIVVFDEDVADEAIDNTNQETNTNDQTNVTNEENNTQTNDTVDSNCVDSGESKDKYEKHEKKEHNFKKEKKDKKMFLVILEKKKWDRLSKHEKEEDLLNKIKEKKDK